MPRTAEALRGYEMVLTKEPNRYRAFAGAMQAAEKTGDAKKTAFFAERLLEQTAAADSQRPEMAQARKVLAGSSDALGPRRRGSAGDDRARPLGSRRGRCRERPAAGAQGRARERAVIAYNAGVKLLLDKKYADAQTKFEEALAADEQLAEAHNNLAFSLRMQSPANRALALKHYDRALDLKPDLAQAYMYRGVLFTQMGDLDRARADHARLLKLDRALATKLERVIAGEGRDDKEGVASQYE
jgi:tetratricopeptide (TPR) repeat protein